MSQMLSEATTLAELPTAPLDEVQRALVVPVGVLDASQLTYRSGKGVWVFNKPHCTVVAPPEVAPGGNPLVNHTAGSPIREVPLQIRAGASMHFLGSGEMVVFGLPHSLVVIHRGPLVGVEGVLATGVCEQSWIFERGLTNGDNTHSTQAVSVTRGDDTALPLTGSLTRIVGAAGDMTVAEIKLGPALADKLAVAADLLAENATGVSFQHNPHTGFTMALTAWGGPLSTDPDYASSLLAKLGLTCTSMDGQDQAKVTISSPDGRLDLVLSKTIPVEWARMLVTSESPADVQTVLGSSATYTLVTG